MVRAAAEQQVPSPTGSWLRVAGTSILANLGAIGGEIRRMHYYAAAPPTPDSCDATMQDPATDQVRGPTRLGVGDKLFS
jgi:hypothetical protein